MQTNQRHKQGCPALVLTGDRRRGRHLVRVYGQPVWLSGTLFAVLCQLVCGQVVKASGFVAVSRNAIYRLRKELEGIAQKNGRKFIETGGATEYRLNLDLNDVAIERSFCELQSIHVLSDAEIETIRKSCQCIK